jgi:type IV pilus assembly protein PilW
MNRIGWPAAGERGFTLVEMMIGIFLGVLIMTALTTLFVDMSRTNREMAKTNSQIENARFAMDILQGDFVHGGYWGGFVPEFDDLTRADAPTDVPTGVPAPCEAFATWDAADLDNILRSRCSSTTASPPAAPGWCASSAPAPTSSWCATRAPANTTATQAPGRPAASPATA